MVQVTGQSSRSHTGGEHFQLSMQDKGTIKVKRADLNQKLKINKYKSGRCDPE